MIIVLDICSLNREVYLCEFTKKQIPFFSSFFY